MNYKAIGHCRVSKGDQEEIKNSLNSQKSQIEKFADKLKIKPDEIQWFIEDEARSAYSDRADWSLFEEAINEACNNKNIKYFIDFSQERFCRNRRKSQRYKDKLRNNAVQLRFVSGDVEDPDSDSGFWQDGIQEMVAEAYSRKVGADTLRGCLENAVTRDPETGYAYKNGGSPPWWLKAKRVAIGKDKYGDDIKKTIWIKNDTLHTTYLNNELVTKTIWDWARYCYIQLRLKEELSLDQTRDALNDLEIPGPRGNMWNANTLFYTEKNEALHGAGIYNRKKYSRGGSGKLKDRSEWVEIPNAHPALITKDEFEALQNLAAAKKRVENTSPLRSSRKYLLIGAPDKFTCTSCGGNIITSGGIYTCGTYNRHGKKGCGASFFSINQDWLEEKVLKEIQKFCTDKIFDKIYLKTLPHYEKQPDKSIEIKSIQKALSLKEKEEQNLLNNVRSIDSSKNDIAIQVISEEINKVSQEKIFLQKQLKKLQTVSSIAIPDKNQVKKHLNSLKSMLTHSSPVEKRQILWMFIKSLKLDPVERSAIAEFQFDPIQMFLEKSFVNRKSMNKSEKTPLGSSTDLVAGARFELATFGL